MISSLVCRATKVDWLRYLGAFFLGQEKGGGERLTLDAFVALTKDSHVTH